MLCDQLIRESRRLRSNGSMDRYYRRVADLCAKGERFVIDNETIDLLLNVEDSKPKTLESALPLCKLPFPIMWIEYDLIYRMKQLVNYGYDPVIPPGVKTMQGGLLIVASDDTLQRGRIYGCGSDNNNSVMVNPVALDFDLTDENHIKKRFYKPGFYELFIKPDYVATINSSKEIVNQNGYTKKLSLKEIEMLAALEDRFLFSIEDDAGKWLQELRARSPEDMRICFEASARDWGGERRFVLGLLLFLNTRNLYVTHTRSLREKNSQRSPRVKPDVVSHKIIRLSLTKVGRNRAEASGINTDQAMRAHIVRGHWKVRRTGVFFWRPYERGDSKTGIVDKTYRVVP